MTHVTTHRSRVRRCLAAGAVVAFMGAGMVQPPLADPPEPPRADPAPAGPVGPAPAPTGETQPPPRTAPVGEPREAIVTLKDGQRYRGEVVEQGPQRIVLKIAGIETPINLSLVDRVDIQPPLLDQYREMRATIDDKDVERLLLVVEWLRVREQWELAVAELDHILDLQPDNAEARRLKLLIDAQRDLAQAPVRVGGGGQQPPAPAPAPIDFPLLSDKDVSLIKVYEIDLADPPRMLISRETITRLIDEHAADPLIPKNPQDREALYRMSPARILDLMFRLQARNLYAEVKVLDSPRPMRLFRDNVHKGLVINSCATARCHGGPGAGRLMLTNRRPNHDATVYTNFLILERFKLADGKPMIDYEAPAASPLLNYALPREMASVRHPRVPGPEGRGDLWRPFFRSPDDQRFLDAIEWVTSMYRPRPEYPIVFHAPVPEPVTPKPGEPPVVR